MKFSLWSQCANKQIILDLDPPRKIQFFFFGNGFFFTKNVNSANLDNERFVQNLIKSQNVPKYMCTQVVISNVNSSFTSAQNWTKIIQNKLTAKKWNIFNTIFLSLTPVRHPFNSNIIHKLAINYNNPWIFNDLMFFKTQHHYILIMKFSLWCHMTWLQLFSIAKLMVLIISMTKEVNFSSCTRETRLQLKVCENGLKSGCTAQNMVMCNYYLLPFESHKTE